MIFRRFSLIKKVLKNFFHHEINLFACKAPKNLFKTGIFTETFKNALVND